MSKTYYSLRFERSDAFHKAGDQVANADNTLYIGQTDSCDIRIGNESQYEDAAIAVIEKRADGRGWKLISLSPYKEHEVRVNGTPINHVHFLSHGDRIAFEGQRQELTFSIRDDGMYNATGIVAMEKRGNRPVIAWLAVISVALIGFALLQLYKSPMSKSMKEKAMKSVYQIEVNSVQLIAFHDDGSTTIVDSVKIENEFGTAFLTTDGCLVTARHCIEPWLNLPEGTKMDTADSSTPAPVRMALKATTLNIIAQDDENDSTHTHWQMISYCSLKKPDIDNKVLLRFTSTDFIIDDSRDHIMEYGDFDHQYFWRSIKVRPSRTDMMLGDIAFLPHADSLLHRTGTIKMASKEEVVKLCDEANRDLVIMGRTPNDANKDQLISSEANLMLQITEANCTEGYPNMVIAHDGKIGPGFSGGPVMTRAGLLGWRVIGVVSVIDSKEKDWYYSVPISEIERMKNSK